MFQIPVEHHHNEKLSSLQLVAPSTECWLTQLLIMNLLTKPLNNKKTTFYSASIILNLLIINRTLGEKKKLSIKIYIPFIIFPFHNYLMDWNTFSIFRFLLNIITLKVIIRVDDSTFNGFKCSGGCGYSNFLDENIEIPFECCPNIEWGEG